MLGRASTVNLLPLLCIMAATSTTINSTPLTSNHETSPDQQLPQQADTNQQDSQTYMSNYVKQQRSPLMQVRKLSSAGNNITCNDGSQVGYYQRLNQHSKSWVIYLQGGGFCGSRESCRQRWHRTPLLMSSKYWSNTKTVDGILSSDPKENPYLWNANHIYVPYCSSDSWTGLQPATSQPLSASDDQEEETTGSVSEPSSFAFLGSKIVERVFESLYDDLPLRQSLYDAKFILLAGDSAGATGVILNLDKMASLVEKRANFLRANCTQQQQQQQCELKQSRPVLRGLADSGWFLDNEPYNFELEFGEPILGGGGTGRLVDTNESSQQRQHSDQLCDQGRCTPLQLIKQAMQLWNGQVPESCMQNYVSEPWRCYFGYRVYQTLRTPLFVVQWLYDEAQLMVDNIVKPGTNGQWNYVNKVVNEMRNSLENVTALFAPSCLSHGLIARKSWNQININGFRLPHILNSWEEQPLPLLAVEPTSGGYSTAISSPPSVSRQIQDALERNSKFSNQPTFERVLLEQESPSTQSTSSSPTTTTAAAAAAVGQTNLAAAAFHLRSADRLSVSLAQELRNQIIPNRQQTTSPAASAAAAGNGQTTKSRTRKRKRNQQQQQNRIKQSGRQRSSNQQSTTTTTSTNGPLDLAFTSTINPLVHYSTAANLGEANDLPQQQPTLNSHDLLPLMDASSSSSSSSSSELLYGRVNRGPADQTNGAGIRLGRSTIVDDSTLTLSNNVPDDGGSASRITMSQLTAISSSSSLAPPQLSMVNSQTNFQDQSSETSSSRWSTDSRSQGLNYGAHASSSRGDTFGPDQFRFIDTCGWPQCNRDCPVMGFEFLSGMSIQF